MKRFISVAILNFAIISTLTSVGKTMAEVSFQPEDITTLWIMPETTSNITWNITGLQSTATQTAKNEYKYIVYDYCENPFVSGEASATTDGKIKVSLSLPQGYYSLEFVSTGQRFGIVSMEPYTGQRDPFFCIDTAMSWLVGKTSMPRSRESLIRILARCGVAMARERLGWNNTVQPSIDKWNWEGDRDYDTIRKCYVENDIPLLEMFHTCPDHIGKTIGRGNYRMPLDMIKVSRSWNQMGNHWSNTWGALEVWNELDGASFSGNAPADQYAPMVKTIAYTFDRDKMSTPLVGGVVAYGWDEGYLDLAQRNGILDNIDVWSVHTYGHNSALKIQHFMKIYRDAFKKIQKTSMPIWDTESGFAWTAKASRPPVEQGAASAAEITMKGIECLCCGMARYFPFVYPYYAEEICNYSMTDKMGTPLRSMAAYGWAIKALSNKAYLGDWRCKDSSVKRARVFGKGEDVVLVLYSGEILPIANVSDEKKSIPADYIQVELPKDNVEIYGIDGRRLKIGENNTVPIRDGLTYVFMKKKDIEPFLITNTQAMELYKLAHQPMSPRKTPSPIVLQFRPDATDYYQSSVKGYIPLESAPEKLRVPIDITNLGKEACGVNVTLYTKKGKFGEEKVQVVPGLKTARTEWQIPWGQEIRLSPDTQELKVVAETSTGEVLDSIYIKLKGRPTLQSWLTLFSKRQKLPITNINSWHPSAISGATMKMSSPAADTWQLNVDFHDAKDRWVYPRFYLPNNLDLSKYTGIVFEGRCRAGALAVRTVLWERQKDGGEITFMTGNILASDDKWHPVFVPFSGSSFGASAVDPNNRLKRENVKVMSFGMNSWADENTLEIRNVWLVVE